MMQKISKAELAARLEARVECAEGGVEGLNILLYGWKELRKYMLPNLPAIAAIPAIILTLGIIQYILGLMLNRYVFLRTSPQNVSG